VSSSRPSTAAETAEWAAIASSSLFNNSFVLSKAGSLIHLLDSAMSKPITAEVTCLYFPTLSREPAAACEPLPMRIFCVWDQSVGLVVPSYTGEHGSRVVCTASFMHNLV
jgi:hypothetical protein